MNGTDTGSRYSYPVRGNRRAGPPRSGEKSARFGRIVPPAATQMRRPDRKFECGNEGGKSLDVTNMMDRRKLEVCVEETKWKADRAREMGGGGKSNGVGIIVSEKISKDVVREERRQGRIIVAWMKRKKQLVCIMSVYGPQTGRAETEKTAFGEELERMVGLVEAHVMMCIAGDFNRRVGTAETGEEESIGGSDGEQGIERVDSW